MPSRRRIGVRLASAGWSKAGGIQRRVVQTRLVGGLSDAATCKAVAQSNGGPKQPSGSLDARYLEVQRLRERILEAESYRKLR
jgi:hypothetical protein